MVTYGIHLENGDAVGKRYDRRAYAMGNAALYSLRDHGTVFYVWGYDGDDTFGILAVFVKGNCIYRPDGN